MPGPTRCGGRRGDISKKSCRSDVTGSTSLKRQAKKGRVTRGRIQCGMNNSSAPDMTLSEDDLHACVRVLRAVEADRSHLTRLTPERRRELLTLAGLVAKPERHDVTRMGKAFRRAKREARQVHDRKVMEQAGQRLSPPSPLYAPPRCRTPQPRPAD